MVSESVGGYDFDDRRRLHDDAYWLHTAESASRVATRNNASPLWRVPEPVNADVEEPFDVVEDFTPSL